MSNATTQAIRTAPVRGDPVEAARVLRLGPGPFRLALSYAVLVAITIFFVSPILYMFIASFKPNDKVLAGLGGFVPQSLSFNNYADVFSRFNGAQTGTFGGFFLTSVIVSAVIVVSGLVVNSTAAYALARLRWPGRDLVLLGVIALVILPFEAIAVPLFYMLNGLRNTYVVQFLPFIANPFSIYLFYTFFVGLPKSLEEAARVDGAGPWRTFLFIMLPNAKPVFATVTTLQFLASWASFLWPVMVIDNPDVRPLPLAISVFQGTPPIQWGDIMAFGVMMVLPVLVVFLVFQRWFIQSVVASGVKG
jgi:multiple sugar transport system permease protein